MKRQRPRLLLWSFVLCACSDVSLRSPQQRGEALFRDPGLSPTSLNRFSCQTCHDAEPAPAAMTKKPGAILAGATQRDSFWGGQETDLLSSINQCFRLFMLATTPLASDSPQGEALYAYLDSLPRLQTEPVAFTVSPVAALPRGNAERGAAIYGQACQVCHGTRHEAQGRLTTLAPILPDQTHDEHVGNDEDIIRLAVIDKTRVGGFFGRGGIMPPFSLETLSDAELSDILEYLEFLGN